jgi:formylglycine-generating enzyme required for sulfatase activity
MIAWRLFVKSAASVWTLALAVWLTVLLDRTSADTFGSGENTFEIEFVTIGNPGNVADTTGTPNPAGSVPYKYRIGKFEISQKMVANANNLGGLGITLADLSLHGGNGSNRPATGVSWNEAARFINWLNTTQGFAPAYKFTTQPGTPGYSANEDIQVWQPGDAGYHANYLFRNQLARYFLPSVDEWYKAAYYDPNANGGAGGYWNYPTGSDSIPTPVTSGIAAGTAVVQQSLAQGPADIMLAGGLSPYGVMALGGNVFEWEETEWDLDNDSGPSLRGVRGGYWSYASYPVGDSASIMRFNSWSSVENWDKGFRVASIAEPSSLLLAALGVAGMLLWRQRFTQSKTTRLAAVLSAALMMPSVAHAVTIETVPIGNPGNAPDMRYNLDQRPEGYGAVPYRYRIGKYEVTAGQYTEFLNAVAADDRYGLYSLGMDDEFGCNIRRRGDPGSYTYSVAPDWADRPVNEVSFLDAVRFANWLHNGQPTGPQEPGTTEDGAYMNVRSGFLVARQPGARFFIPTEHEWYKAAYHNRSAGQEAGYFDYPTGTDVVPGRDLTETSYSGNNANYRGESPTDYLIGHPYYRTEGGEFELSDSPYGTFDQGGNLFEWNETRSVDLRYRGLRGGAFNFEVYSLHASSFYPYGQSEYGHRFIGFRVASIPEPGTITLVVCGAVAGLIWWRRQPALETSSRRR